jgi:hypothetical protein
VLPVSPTPVKPVASPPPAPPRAAAPGAEPVPPPKPERSTDGKVQTPETRPVGRDRERQQSQ